MKFAKPVTLSVGLVVAVAMTLLFGGVTNAGAATGAPTATAPVISGTTVAHTVNGKMIAKVSGQTANGRTVTGSFIPLKFSAANGKLYVRGLINGVVHNASGTTSTFSSLRTMQVKSINGVKAVSTATATKTLAAAAAAQCDILHLVLGPLDLNLLGLKVHLDKVVLDIVAVPGAGNLLGNLLCAVAGLLDGGLSGLLGRIGALLNQVLGALKLGL